MGTVSLKSSASWFHVFVFASVGVFACYLLWFTLFDGFATFSNDAGSYVLVARKWSWFFEPTVAELFTWPHNSYPPGFSFVLAITGASESLLAGHLVVSICLMISVVMMAYYAGLKISKPVSAALVVAFCLVPGIVIHSLGILSENLYLLLSLGALLTFQRIRHRAPTPPALYSLLFVCVAGCLLTRTVGLALIVALLVVAALRREMISKQRLVLGCIALGSIAAWLVWESMRPMNPQFDYGFHLSRMLGAKGDGFGELLSTLWTRVFHNLVTMLGSWNQYFTAGFDGGVASFAFNLIVLSGCLLAAAVRAFRLKLSAVYLFAYLAILLLWPQPEQMPRFLHPIVFLLLLQPVFYWAERRSLERSRGLRLAALAVCGLLGTQSLFAQVALVKQKISADPGYPTLAHSPEYYLQTIGQAGERQGKSFSRIFDLLETSATLIGEDAIVATLSPEVYAVIADRRAVSLTSRVTLEQQLCNFKLQGVDIVFLTDLTTGLNLRGASLFQDYQLFTTAIGTMTSADEAEFAYLMVLDPAAIETRLETSSFRCESVTLFE